MVELYYGRKPWDEQNLISRQDLTEKIVGEMVKFVKKAPKPLPGIRSAFTALQRFFPNASMAVASSSPLKLIEATLDSLGLSDVLKVSCLYVLYI